MLSVSGTEAPAEKKLSDRRWAARSTAAPLTDLVTRCMATDPDDRPVSAAEVLRDLEGMEG
jgi:hypothetical protein